MASSDDLMYLVRQYGKQHAQKVSSAERLVKELKARSLEVDAKLAAKCVSLDTAKLERNRAENELKELATELATFEGSVRARQARIQNRQADIAPLRMRLEEAHLEEARLRDKFICDMQVQNSALRKMNEEQSQRDLKLILLNKRQQLEALRAEVALSQEHQACQVAPYAGQVGRASVDKDDEMDERLEMIERLAQSKQELEALSIKITTHSEHMFSFYRGELVKQVICPDCGSDNMEQILAEFAQAAESMK